MSEHPRERHSFRDWFLSATVGLLVVVLWRLQDPIRAWILVPAVMVAVLATYYLQHLGRISVSSDVIRVRRWGRIAEYARDRIVIATERLGGVQMSLNDGTWVMFSWPFFVPSGERRARASGLLKALGSTLGDGTA